MRSVGFGLVLGDILIGCATAPVITQSPEALVPSPVGTHLPTVPATISTTGAVRGPLRAWRASTASIAWDRLTLPWLPARLSGWRGVLDLLSDSLGAAGGRSRGSVSV